MKLRAMIIDFHAHAFPDARAGAVMDDMEKKSGIPAYSDGTVAGLIKSMDRTSVTHSVVSRITTFPGHVSSVNKWLASIRNERLYAAATLHPDDPDLFDEIARIKAQGFTGVKLHPDYQCFRVDERRVFPLYKALEELGFWVLFHSGLDRGLPGEPLSCRPQWLLTVLRNFPKLKVIAAHMGGEEIYHETEEFLVGREVYLDTSFVLRKMGDEPFKRLVRQHSPEKILWGSDTPWNDQGADAEYIRTRPYLTEREKEAVLFGNARGLLGI